MGTKVFLRQKAISAERHSLYLDFYPPITNPKTGSLTRREFLGHYIYDKPKDHLEKQHNKNTMQLAEQIRQKRDSYINKPEIYTDQEKELLKIKEFGQKNFVEYFKVLAEKRKASNHDNWISSYHYLKNFTSGTILIANLSERFCNDFREYLMTTNTRRSKKTRLSQNSAVSYFNKFKAALKQAFKDGLLQTDLNAKIETIKQAETQRNFLTIEEVNMLVKAECPNPVLKQAALFSALTGLRFVDLEKLIWSELEYIEGNGFFIKFRQKKTKGVEMMPISDQAFRLLGERKNSADKVFEDFKYSHCTNSDLTTWLDNATITKHITFHCFRHTFATLQLSLGTDIYTVSKMLGHRDLKTTQVYAKIIDKTKREAANRIKLDLQT
jgi:integrase